MKKYIRPLFAVYAVVMLWLLFGQRIGTTDFSSYFSQLKDNINLIPFRTVRLFWNAAKGGNSYWIWQAVRNISGNVILFIPLGLLSFIYPKLSSFTKYVLTIAAAICCVELIQFFTLLGRCDVDDLILNLFGAVIGFFAVNLCMNLSRKK